MPSVGTRAPSPPSCPPTQKLSEPHPSVIFKTFFWKFHYIGKID